MSTENRSAAALALFRALQPIDRDLMLRQLWRMVRRSKRGAETLRPFRKYAPDNLAGLSRRRGQQ